MQSTASLFNDILKFNPYHDRLGRFATSNSAASFTFRTKDPNKQHLVDRAIAREKERTAVKDVPKSKKKKTYGDFLKDKKKKDMDFFYGEGNYQEESNKYFKFKRVLDDDNCIIVTNNIATIKGNPIMIVGSNQAIYLKDWQFREVRNYFNDVDAYAVKLNRKYYKPYTFHSDFANFHSDKNYTFDDIMDMAKQQQAENMKVAQGHTKYFEIEIPSIRFEKSFLTFSDVMKFNPYHDNLGRFSSAGSAASFTYKPGASTAHSKAIERAKEQDSTAGKGFKGTLYHGSPNTDIQEFDMKRAGKNTSSGEKLLFFTDSKQMAEDFSYERLDGSSKFFQQRGKKGRVYEVDVEMKNPLDFRKLSDNDIDNILKLDAEGLLTKPQIQLYAQSNHQLLKAGLTLTAESLQKLGYDGLIANTGKAGHNSLEYAVVSSEQAKIKKSVTKALTFSELAKFNPYHDSRGRFTTAGGASSFTFRTRSKLTQNSADIAVAREKDRHEKIMPTKEQAKTLKGIENRTRNLKKEQFRVVDRDGNVVMEKQGGKHSVSYSMGEAREHFPGNITIHNHPSGGTFSTADFSDLGHGATEIRAAAPEGTYILRNTNHGTKWTTGQKSWLDMRDDLELAALDFKSGFSLKKEVRATFAEEQKKTTSLAEKFIKAMNDGASKEVLDGLRQEYYAAESALKVKVEAATRKAYTDQYHNWLKSNAMNYGMEYEFVPVTTRTKKSFGDDDIMTEDFVRKSDDIVLDEKMNRDIAELTESIMDELIDIKKSASYNQADKDLFDSSFQITKADEDKRLVFGWALVSATSDGQQIIDHQGDILDQSELEQGAYEYVLNFRDAGEEHISTLRKKARMVESVVFTSEKLKAMGIPEGIVPYGWWIGFYVDDDRTWELVKNGTYKMFSIEGRAIREPVSEPLAKAYRNFEDFPEFGMWFEENMDATKEDIEAADEYYKNLKKRKVAKTFSEVLKFNFFK